MLKEIIKISCLYIGGAQCIHAKFLNDHWDGFDVNQKKLKEIAEKFNVFVKRYTLDDQDEPSFVIMNEKANHECFYSSAAFEYNMTVNQSDTFLTRALDFIKEVESDENLSQFHFLNWSTEPKVLYFVTS